jgi:hypothetical protein
MLRTVTGWCAANRRIVASAVVVAMSLGGIGLSAGASRPSSRAAAWVASHRSKLPRELEQLAAYPEAYRLAAFATYEPKEKAHLWQEQLQAILAREKLTTEQRAFVGHLLELVTPESFEPGAKTPEMCKELADLFPDKRQFALFKARAIGAAVEAEPGLRSEFISLRESLIEWMHSEVTVSASDDCTCRGAGWCECYPACGYACACFHAPQVPGCTTNNNCGCIWSSTCDGTCWFTAAPEDKSRTPALGLR